MNYEQDLHWASKVSRERRTEREGRSVLLKQFKIQTDLKLVESDMVKYCDISAESTKNQQLPISLSLCLYFSLILLTVIDPPQGHFDVNVNLFLLLDPTFLSPSDYWWSIRPTETFLLFAVVEWIYTYDKDWDSKCNLNY